MFKRVMVAVVGLPLLILILGWAPSWATMVLTAGMCAIGAWELMHAAAGEKGKPLIPLTVAAAALVPRDLSTFPAIFMASSMTLLFANFKHHLCHVVQIVQRQAQEVVHTAMQSER